VKIMLSRDSDLPILPTPTTFPVLGLQVHLLDNYLSWLVTRLQQKIGTHVVTLNAEMSMMAQENVALKQVIVAAELVIPDGAGVIIYMRLRGRTHQRCPGIELAASLIEYLGTSELSDKLCFFGGSPGTPEQAAKAWQERFSSLSILTQDGYVSGAAAEAWKQTLKEQQPAVIFVGIGVPRQELWIQENRHLCPDAIWVGVGGSLDIWAGTKERAPEWLRNNNLEWSYRLYQEPWRWRRMLSLPKFFWRSLWA
jgi:N-acetylglucosaminyldiphosphoundecaprenol N-acetyl-beta-D-mannosaminyltransferase